MKKNNLLIYELNWVFKQILAGTNPRSRARTMKAIAMRIRRNQMYRIARQKNPDGSEFEKRRRRVMRSQGEISFIWNGDERYLKNWYASKGRRGRMLTGFDLERGAVRSFYRKDIERYLEINHREVRRNTTKKTPMFRRLRTARFLIAKADANSATIGYSGRTARLARIHQFGLVDEVGGGVKARYPRRELLGLTDADIKLAQQMIIDSLGVK